jgi:hypothetical protein
MDSLRGKVALLTGAGGGLGTEALVYPGPIRPGLVLGLVAPRLAERLNERLGLGRMFRPVAEARGTLGSGRVVRAGRGPGSQDQLLRS